LNSRFGKYKRYYQDSRDRKRNFNNSAARPGERRDQDQKRDRDQKYSRPEGSSSRQRESAPRKYDEDDANRCYQCKRPGHYQYDCPELSTREREDRKAVRDKKYAKHTAMVADAESDGHSGPDSFFSDSDDDDLCLMAREENEVQSPCSVGSSVHPHERSSDSAGEIDLQLSLEQLMVDFTRLQETNVHIGKENEKLTAEIKRLNDSGCTDHSKTEFLNKRLIQELELLKTNLLEKDAKLVELANDQVVKYNEIKQWESKFNDLFQRHETLKVSEEGMRKKIAAINKSSVAIEEIHSYQLPASHKHGLGFDPSNSSPGPQEVAPESNSERVFVPPKGKGTFTVQTPKGKDKGKKPVDSSRPKHGYVKPKPKGKAKQSAQGQGDKVQDNLQDKKKVQDNVPQGGRRRYYQGKPSRKGKSNLTEPQAEQPSKVVPDQAPESSMPKDKGILNPSQKDSRPAAPKSDRKGRKPGPWKHKKVAPTDPKTDTHTQSTSKAPVKKKTVYVDVNGRQLRPYETVKVVWQIWIPKGTADSLGPKTKWVPEA
jgi:hypothetical protein